MLEITSHRNGELLNSRAGRETSAGLEITINGMADPQSSVKINGIPAEKHDRMFSGRLLLTEKINKVTVSSHDKFGDRTQTITLVWDKASFKRYATRIDDNVFFFTDLARERPARIMDHFYLAGLKKLHDKYGTKFILKCFYKNDHDKNYRIGFFNRNYFRRFLAVASGFFKSRTGYFICGCVVCGNNVLVCFRLNTGGYGRVVELFRAGSKCT